MDFFSYQQIYTNKFTPPKIRSQIYFEDRKAPGSETWASLVDWLYHQFEQGVVEPGGKASLSELIRLAIAKILIPIVPTPTRAYVPQRALGTGYCIFFIELTGKLIRSLLTINPESDAR